MSVIEIPYKCESCNKVTKYKSDKLKKGAVLTCPKCGAKTTVATEEFKKIDAAIKNFKKGLGKF